MFPTSMTYLSEISTFFFWSDVVLNGKQEGATSEEIDRLPKFKFRREACTEKTDGEIHESCGGVMTECNTDTPSERALTREDAVSNLVVAAFLIASLFHCLKIGM